MNSISVFGLGKLGCTMAACFAHKGFSVIGVDIVQETVDCVNHGKSPIYEPGVAELIWDNKHRIRATTDGYKAVLDTDATFVIVPTPSNEDGSFSIRYVIEASEIIGRALKDKSKYHMVVITSTVLPGDMAKIEVLLEKLSGKRCGAGFGLAYNPDFIALGRVVRDFLNPDMILIGQSDPMTGQCLEDIHRRLVNNTPSIHRMSYYNAELAKIGLNSYCTMKITFANVIAEICENMPGGDAEAVCNAIGADSRVGNKYFKGGLGVGGPCFPRDGRAFLSAARRFGVKSALAEATDETNRYQKNFRMPRLIMHILSKKELKSVSILGLTYKEDTTLVEESAAMYLVKELLREGVEVSVYDPQGMPAARKELENSGVSFARSIDECLNDTEVCVVASPWNQMKNIKNDTFLRYMKKNPVVVDCWNIYDRIKMEGVELVKVGKYRHV